MKKDIFQKVVVFLTVLYCLFVIYVFYSLFKTIDDLKSLEGVASDFAEIIKCDLIFGIVFNIIELFVFAFGIYCISIVGENKREIENLKRNLIKDRHLKQNTKNKKEKECDFCGRLILESDVVCPHCKKTVNIEDEEIEKLIRLNAVDFCEGCGYQLFDDDLDCPNCGKRRDKK